MAISKEDAIKELQNRDMVYVAYSQFTKLPYVKCDEETFNDQAWIFSTEEGIKEFGKKLLDDKLPSLWVCVMRKKIIQGYMVLFMQLV